MGQNKEQLKKLLSFIDTLSKQEGNEWFLEEIKRRFCKEITVSDSKIDEIYELCIEKILREQANQFYKDFPIKEINPQLIEDFIRMEQFRRKNKFEDFCLAMYQQVECITNRIGREKVLNDVALKLMGYPAYTDGNIKNRIGEYQIAKLLFMDKVLEKSDRPISEHFAVDKIRCIIYFVCYKANMQSNDYNNFIEINELMNELYQYRNKNHRDTLTTEYQKKIYDKINPIKDFYYLKLIGVFATFIEKISYGYPITSDLINFANGTVPKAIKKPEPKIVGYIDPEKLRR